jgi:RecB family exonuclease
VRLIVGPPNSGRAGEIRRLLAESAEREPVLVVPTGDDAAWFERELCADGSPALGVSIRTFAWLVEDVAQALGVEAGAQLSAPQRLALIRAAIVATPLRHLRRSSARSGFAPALDALLEELGSALVTPDDLRRTAEELDDGAHEAELAALYASYAELRDRTGRDDRGSLALKALGGIRAAPDAWQARPVFLYGFDDLTRAQLELVAELGRATEITIAVNYADLRSLAARATLLAELSESLGAETLVQLAFDPAYTSRASLRHLSQGLFEPGAGTVDPDDGLVLMESAGERGEGEAIGLEIARLLADGADPGEIAVALRSPAAAGPSLAATLSRYGIPVALEADAPLTGTSVGRALTALCRAAADGGADDLLAHLRADPTVPPGLADGVERRIRRGEAVTADEAVAGWSSPPRHLTRLRSEQDPVARLRALAEIAHEIAEGPHRGAAPLAGAGSGDGGPLEPATPLAPLELRAAVAAAELLEELAVLGELPGCEPPGPLGAAEALEGASVRLWRGPTEGRVRILSPYRLRTGRVRYLFCASLQDGEFPAAAAPDPLLGDDRRGRLGIAALRRRDAAEEERYLFGACVSRPTDRLYISWQSCDDDGGARARSPFVDEVLDLIGPSPEAAEAALKRIRGIERVVAEAAEAPSERELARSLALAGRQADHAAALEALGVTGDAAERVLGMLAAIPDPAAKPGPLAVPAVVDELRSRRLLSAGSLENWIECPYRWFVDHELRPQRLEPESDPLWIGGVVHDALERLYTEAPGADSIPRPGDVERWKERFAELLEDCAARPRRAHDPPPVEGSAREPERISIPPLRAAALARAREQVESFLEAESQLETELRPAMLERGFGFDEEQGDPGPLDLGDFALRGRIDRIDVAGDGRGAVVRDYKTGSNVTGAGGFADEGVLQIPLYMQVVRELLALEPIAGLYQPLGAAGGKRRPRGLGLKDDERLDGLDLVRRGGSKDLCEPDEFEAHLAAATERARVAGAEMRAGAIGRRPLGGNCPKYCEFQPICRLERALGLPDEENGA